MTAAQRAAEARRQRLLRACAVVLHGTGIVDARLDDVRAAVAAADAADAARAGDAAGAAAGDAWQDGFFTDLRAIEHALVLQLLENRFAALQARLVGVTTAEAAVHALVLGHLDWVLSHPIDASSAQQILSVRGGPADRTTVNVYLSLLHERLGRRLAPFIDAGALPRWHVATYEVAVLGPAHEAGRRLLDDDRDAAWCRATLPAVAWATAQALVAASTKQAKPTKPTKPTKQAKPTKSTKPTKQAKPTLKKKDRRSSSR